MIAFSSVPGIVGTSIDYNELGSIKHLIMHAYNNLYNRSKQFFFFFLHFNITPQIIKPESYVS